MTPSPDAPETSGTDAPEPRSPGMFGRPSLPEARHIADLLRADTVGGLLMLGAAVIALIWANSPVGDAYQAMRELTFGPESLHLDLNLQGWVSDGILAVFFFAAGLELKREFVTGDLRDPRKAVLPIVAACFGVAFPAIVYLLVTRGTEGTSSGWAVPSATDIAFALAVLAVIASHLPSGMRSFLLTLAVVDDLIVIVIIAIFYTSEFSLLPLLGTLVPLAIFALLVQRRVTSWWLLIPLAVLTWGLLHASGVHATIAGVALGLVVPAMRREGEDHSVAERLEHRISPISAGICVPVFALFAAGVAIDGGLGGLGSTLTDPVALGVIGGLVIGKPVGVMLGTFLAARFTSARLDEDLSWLDVFGLALLAGVGFTVSLLVGELAFGDGSEHSDAVRAAVLTGSVISAVLASVVLRMRDSHHRKLWEAENTDTDADDVPDAWDRAPHDPTVQ